LEDAEDAQNNFAIFSYAQVSMKTEVTWVRDMLRGDDAFELQVKLLKQVPEEYPYKDDE
jgi:uncharacterized pyridoxamine 5'-phosphate oxidase family protein